MKYLTLGAIAACLLAAPALAQLSGSYTIDNTAATGGSNYNSFIDAANDLMTMGVSGPVIFAVSPGMGPYAGFSLGPVTGTSATNTVTFMANPGPRPVISGAAAGYTHTVLLSSGISTTSLGPSYVILDGFEITGAPSGTQCLGVGCNFVTIRNCVAHTGGSGIGLTNSFDCVIEDNEVYGTNHLPGSGGSTSYSGGISAYYNSGRNTIQRNRVHDCVDNGMFIGSSGSSTATPDNVIINNFIWNCGNQSSATYAGGIALRRATNSIVANNSVSMPAAATNRPGIYIMGGSSAASSALVPMECSNNLIQHNGTGACLQTEYTGIFPATTDYNCFDIGTSGAVGAIGTSFPGTQYAPLAAWQAAESVDLNSVEGAAGFLTATDLHITPSSPAFNAGSTVAAVMFDIDLQPRPLGGVPDIGADEAPAMGLFAAFTGSPTSGPAGMTVNFTDLSYSSSGPITSWAWDFDNDSVIDSNLQNPSYTYNCPGSFTVSLTVNDGVNPASTQTLANYITVGNFAFDIQTSGGGVGDLIIYPVPTTCGQAVGAAQGWTLVSLATNLPVGAGPAFGLVPDSSFWTFLFSPALPNSIPHFVPMPGLYPNGGPVLFPAGFFAGLSGISLDAVMVFLNPNGTVLTYSNADRVTF